MAETDELLMCRFCWNDGRHVKATHVAGQHTGGDVDQPATWVLVCTRHADRMWLCERFDLETGEYYEGVLPESERLPMFRLS